MLRLITAIVAFFILATTSFGQGKDNSLKGTPFKERIVTGGGFGLGFGSVQDFVSVSPVIGYSLTKKLIVGTGVTYRYTNYKVFRPSIKFMDYGVSPFVRYNVYRGFFLQSEYEMLNYELLSSSPPETIRANFSSFLAGGGVVQPLGKNLAFYVMALYNFSYTPTQTGYTPYTSPWIVRAGVNVGGFLGF